MSPRVSVLLPFRNAQTTLERAIVSMVGQTFTDWELILVNNASTDHGEAIARQWAAQDRRIHLLREPNPGIVRALHRGLSEACAPLIARMDADDVSYPTRLATQYTYLREHPEVQAVGCRVRYHSSGKSHPGMQTYVDWVNTLLNPDDIQRNRFVESPLVHPSVMFQASLLAEYDTYRTGPFPEDYELWLRWLDQGVILAKCPEVLLDWYDSTGRLSRTDDRYLPEAFYRIKTQYLARWLDHHNPFHPQVVVWGGGRKSRQRMRLLECHGIEVQAIIDVVPHKTTTAPCIFYQDIAPPGQYFVLSYVGNRGRRNEIRRFLQQQGYQEGIDFLLVA